MSEKVTGIIKQMNNTADISLLDEIGRGIEKESLRIQPNGRLAKTRHPYDLGSALTHPHITTDFSEALLELITGVHHNIDQLLEELDDIHRFVYSQLKDEYLWVASMPCILEGDNNIPIAQYGCSNSAKMKTIYRVGLGYRYGRLMQTIAGIHYNFSMSEKFWHWLKRLFGDTGSLQDFKTKSYLGLIRNFHRYSWLLTYLFGASPAACKSFLVGRQHQLLPFDDHTLYAPEGTSLRMSNLGYQSSAQEKLQISYNSLSDYLKSLQKAISESHPDYERIGVKQDGVYRQLNTNLLQIENEFYSSIRPKRVTQDNEAPRTALLDRGVEYIEVRCIDVNPYHPLGIDKEQIHFLDTFLTFCLLEDSPELDNVALENEKYNLKKVVYQGRDPKLELVRAGGNICLRKWGLELLQELAPVAAALDRANDHQDFSKAVAAQITKINDPTLTPSAQILADMKTRKMSYFNFTMEKVLDIHRKLSQPPLAPDKLERFIRTAELSLQEQANIELADSMEFDDYLASYFAQ